MIFGRRLLLIWISKHGNHKCRLIPDGRVINLEPVLEPCEISLYLQEVMHKMSVSVAVGGWLILEANNLPTFVSNGAQNLKTYLNSIAELGRSQAKAHNFRS